MTVFVLVFFWGGGGSWVSCIPTGTVQAQEKTGMKPLPTISLTPASNLWVIQMWVEALDESFLRGCTGKLCTTINVDSPGTQMVELKGKPSKYNKTLLLHVTWCTLHTKCHVMKCRFFSVTEASMWIRLVIEVQSLTQSMTQAIHSLSPADVQYCSII